MTRTTTLGRLCVRRAVLRICAGLCTLVAIFGVWDIATGFAVDGIKPLTLGISGLCACIWQIRRTSAVITTARWRRI